MSIVCAVIWSSPSGSMIPAQYQRYCDDIAYGCQLHGERTPPRPFGHFESLLSLPTQPNSRKCPVPVQRRALLEVRPFLEFNVLSFSSAIKSCILLKTHLWCKQEISSAHAPTNHKRKITWNGLINVWYRVQSYRVHHHYPTGSDQSAISGR